MWRSQTLINQLYRGNNKIHIISNHLSTEVCQKAKKLHADLDCIVSQNDRLYNGMVLILYPNENFFKEKEDLCMEMEKKLFIFKTETNRIHHVLHMTRDKLVYKLLKWRSSAGNQTIDTHSHMKDVLFSVLDEIISA